MDIDNPFLPPNIDINPDILPDLPNIDSVSDNTDIFRDIDMQDLSIPSDFIEEGLIEENIVSNNLEDETQSLQNNNLLEDSPLNESFICSNFLFEGFIKDNKKHGIGEFKFDFSDLIFSLGGEYMNEDNTPSNAFTVFKYDHNLYLWYSYKFPPFFYKRSCFSSICYDNFLFIIGGYDGSRAIDSIERYCFLTNEWESMTSLIKRRSSSHSIVWQNKIITIGGVKSSKPLNCIEEYDLLKNESNTFCKMSFYRSGCKGILHGNFLYIFGGFGKTCTSMIEKINMLTKQIEVLPIQYNFGCFSACKVDNYVYLIGGNDYDKVSSRCFIFNLHTLSLTEIASLNYERKFSEAVLYQNKIVVFGGSDGKSNISCVEVYDFMIKKWVIIDSMSYHCIASSVLTCPYTYMNFKAEWYNDKIHSKKTTLSIHSDSYKINIFGGEFSSNKRNGFFRREVITDGQCVNCEHNEICYKDNIPLKKSLFLFEKQISTIYDSIPKSLLCPISLTLMLNPVVISSGKTYEKEAIKKWVSNHRTDPLTRKIIQDTLFYPNDYVSEEVKAFLTENKIDFPQ